MFILQAKILVLSVIFSNFQAEVKDWRESVEAKTGGMGEMKAVFEGQWEL